MGVTADERRALRLGQVGMWASSGMPVDRWCDLNGVSPSASAAEAGAKVLGISKAETPIYGVSGVNSRYMIEAGYEWGPRRRRTFSTTSSTMRRATSTPSS